MRINRKASSLLCGVSALVLACDGSARDPVAPRNVVSTLTAPTSIGASGAGASGYAEIHGTTVQGIKDEIYSFTALSTGSGFAAMGQVAVHFLTFTNNEVTVHAEVTCVSVAGNQAWVGSRVTRFMRDGEAVPARVGQSMVFTVMDVGEDDGATDLASLVFFTSASDGDLAFCNTRPAVPLLRQSTNGGIQVRSE
jgi:hypothetical protein